MNERLGTSICLFSSKGGTGKTITTLNLAGIYEVINKKVLIMDMDLLSGGISLALNLVVKKTIYHYANDCLNKKDDNLKNYVTKYDDYIDVLSCPKDPRQASFISSDVIKKALLKAKYYYDVILIDMSHNINEINLMLLDNCEQILFSMTNDPLDIKNLRNLLAIFKILDKQNYKILLNEAVNPLKKYFTINEMNSLLKTNIEYYLTNEFYLKNMDEYIMNGQIVTLQPKAVNIFSKDFATLTKLATDFIEKGSKNE